MDIRSPRILKIKGLLFLVLGLTAGGLLILDAPSWRNGLLLGLCVWAFCRFYYFAFYVLEHYADSKFRYSGLGDLVTYLMRGRKKP